MRCVGCFLGIAGLVAASACSAPAPSSDHTYQPVGASQIGDLTVEMSADGAIHTGLNRLAVDITSKDGHSIQDSAIEFAPFHLDAQGTRHSAPVLGQPEKDTEGRYWIQTVFPEASDALRPWLAEVRVSRPDQATVTMQLSDIQVEDTDQTRTFTGPDHVTYLLSFNAVEAWKVGRNPVTATLHRVASASDYVPIEDATFSMDPIMIQMGHGAPGSEAPRGTSDGRYEGELNLTMQGAWAITLNIFRDGKFVSEQAFKIAVE